MSSSLRWWYLDRFYVPDEEFLCGALMSSQNWNYFGCLHNLKKLALGWKQPQKLYQLYRCSPSIQTSRRRFNFFKQYQTLHRMRIFSLLLAISALVSLTIARPQLSIWNYIERPTFPPLNLPEFKSDCLCPCDGWLHCGRFYTTDFLNWSVKIWKSNKNN